jgi:hypothetical protein
MDDMTREELEIIITIVSEWDGEHKIYYGPHPTSYIVYTLGCCSWDLYIEHDNFIAIPYRNWNIDKQPWHSTVMIPLSDPLCFGQMQQILAQYHVLALAQQLTTS